MVRALSNGSPWRGFWVLGILIRGMNNRNSAWALLIAAIVIEIGSMPFGSFQMWTSSSGPISVTRQRLK
ncbi:hypothetical protein AAHB60_06085 [Pseudomonas aeruginosa]